MGKQVLFLGMGGGYSHAALQTLVEGGAAVRAVVFPRLGADDAGPRWMPAAAKRVGAAELVVKPVSENILTLAGEHGIPVLEVGSMRDMATLEVIRELQPDLAVTACFPQILPEEFLDIPISGCLNIHPSMLPAYRGPEPLFWQFRAGEQNMGVTVHWMDTGVDTGAVLAQRQVEFAEGMRTEAADRLAASRGAEMILQALRSEEFPRGAQGSEGASYQPAPQDADRRIPAGWGVKRAFNFMRGAQAWAPFWIEAEVGGRLEVSEAVGYSQGVRLGQAFVEQGDEKHVQMGDGILIVK